MVIDINNKEIYKKIIGKTPLTKEERVWFKGNFGCFVDVIDRSRDSFVCDLLTVRMFNGRYFAMRWEYGFEYPFPIFLHDPYEVRPMSVTTIKYLPVQELDN